MFGVGLDRIQDQVKFVGAVDFARDGIEAIGFDGEGFGEVIEPVDPLSGMVAHHEDRAFGRLLAVNQSEMIGAKVEHGRGP